MSSDNYCFTAVLSVYCDQKTAAAIEQIMTTMSSKPTVYIKSNDQNTTDNTINYFFAYKDKYEELLWPGPVAVSAGATQVTITAHGPVMNRIVKMRVVF